jgi:hypothetical protein
MIQILRETQEPPASVQDRLTRAGGLNRFNEPNFRVIWGWNRLAWIGGKFEDRNVSGDLLRSVVELRQEPKYADVNRWHIERWLAPETYGSPRQWYAQTVERADGISVPALGPYPHRGEYEHCFTVQDLRGEFVQLTPTIVEKIAEAIEWSRGRPRAKQRQSIYERESRKDSGYDSWAFDVLDDAVPALHGQPFVTVA